MASSQIPVTNKLFSVKLHEYLQEQPKVCDVTFLVGPTKTKITAVRVVLVVASPVFRKLFQEKWDKGIEVEDDSISLPDVDVDLFNIILQFLPCDCVRVEDLVKYELTPNQVLELKFLSQEYGVEALQHALDEVIQQFIQQFADFAEQPGFLTLTRKNLAAILSSGDIYLNEVAIFNHACRWAEHQCTQLGLNINRENMRKVLGECLYEIRFPLMTFSQLGTEVYARNILTSDELLHTFLYLSKEEAEGNSSKKSLVPFKTMPRNMSVFSAQGFRSMQVHTPLPLQALGANAEWSTVSLYNPLELYVTSPFVCDGSECWDAFRINHGIELLGIGFAGTVSKDGACEVAVEPQMWNVTGWQSFGKTEQSIQAKQGEIIYFMFNEPIVFHPPADATIFNFRINYTFLQGPDMQKVAKYKDYKGYGKFERKEDDVTFAFNVNTKQIVELRFRKLP